MPKDLEEKCKKVYLERLEEEKEKEKKTPKVVLKVRTYDILIIS